MTTNSIYAFRFGRNTRASRWDAYLAATDPDALAAEFASREVAFSVPLEDTHDGLGGFELEDADGSVLFFGRPRVAASRERSQIT